MPARLPASDRRDQLLDAALDLFSRKGYMGATTKEIAATAGVTEAIVFRHFSSKQALYQAVLEHRHESAQAQEFLSAIRDCIARQDDAGFFREIFQAILRSFHEDPRLERLYLFAALEGHEQGLAHVRAVTHPFYEVLRDYVMARQQQGALRDIDPSIILIGISGIAKQYAMLTRMFGYELDLTETQVQDGALSILLNGIQINPLKTRK